MKLFQTIAFSLTIAIVASLINGLLCGLYVFFLEEGKAGGGVVLLVAFFSGLFGAPGIFIFWLCFYIWTIQGKNGQALFRALVKLAVPIAFCSSLLFCWLFRRELPLPVPVAVLAAVLATVSSIFLHRDSIVSLFETAKKPSHV